MNFHTIGVNTYFLLQEGVYLTIFMPVEMAPGYISSHKVLTTTNVINRTHV